MIYDSEKKVFKFFDTKVKSLLLTLKEQTEGLSGLVNALDINQNTFVYIKGRNLLIHDLLNPQSKPKTIQRDSLLRTLALNPNSSIIALADDFGKIYLVHNNLKSTIV